MVAGLTVAVACAEAEAEEPPDRPPGAPGGGDPGGEPDDDDPGGRRSAGPEWGGGPSRSGGGCLRPVAALGRWLALLADTFGLRFLLMCVFGEHLLKGFLTGSGCNTGGLLVVEGLAYVQLQVGASTKSVLMGVSMSCWSMKPLFGLLSDALVVNGYRRTPWIIITSVIATVGYAAIFVAGRTMGPILLCACFFAVRLQNAWTDLMISAAYTEKMRANPEHAADILTWVWWGIGAFTVAGVLVAGVGLDHFDPFTVSGVGIPVAASVILPAALGWLGEKRGPIRCGLDWSLVAKHRPLFLCNAILFTAVVSASVAGLARVSLQTQAAVAIGGSVVVMGSMAALLPGRMWRPMVYVFLSYALTINTYGFVDNFYLDAATPEESLRTGYPVCHNCPHFTPAFYITVVGVCDSLFMVVGSYLFNVWMAKWTYRRALAVTQVLYILASLVDVVQFRRWNTHYGIPDWVFMLGKHAIQNTCGMLSFMPCTIFASHICPPGVESTVFALLDGVASYGAVVSAFVGAYALSLIGLADVGTGPVDDFGPAWKACLINACTPVAVLLLLPLLVPDARMTDPLADALPTVDPDTDSCDDGTDVESTLPTSDDSDHGKDIAIAIPRYAATECGPAA